MEFTGRQNPDKEQALQTMPEFKSIHASFSADLLWRSYLITWSHSLYGDHRCRNALFYCEWRTKRLKVNAIFEENGEGAFQRSLDTGKLLGGAEGFSQLAARALLSCGMRALLL